MINAQSPSSGLVVKMLDIKENDIIIDACAAPGGKAKYISDILEKTNTLYLNDRNQKRYLHLKNNFNNIKNAFV